MQNSTPTKGPRKAAFLVTTLIETYQLEAHKTLKNEIAMVIVHSRHNAMILR
jgi:hypothetical protein